MATQESVIYTKDLFDDDQDLAFDDTKEEESTTATSSSDGTTKHAGEDIESWLMENLKKSIPTDMQSMYINKNNLLFAYQKDPLNDDETDHREKWVSNMTNLGKRTILSSFDISSPYTKIVNNRMVDARKRVAIDYKTDPSFLRVIDSKTGRYILSNLVKAASQQRVALINYVEYVKSNIHLVPLLEELNRYALMQKIAYKDARKQLWFIMKLAEELKLVEKTKGFKYKITIGKTPANDQNIFLLDKHVTAKWLQKKHNEHAPTSSQRTDTTINMTMSDVLTSSYTQDALFNDRILSGDSGLNIALQDNTQPFCGFKSLNIAQDSVIIDPKVLDGMSVSADNVEIFDPALMGISSSNIFTLDDSVEGGKNITSFKGSVTGNSWQALEQLRRKKNKTADTPEVDAIQKTLEKIGSRRIGHEAKNAINTVMVLENACKLYGTGPKWSNPDKNEFDAINRKNKLVYIKPPKNVRQNSIAYHYLMQYKSIHQKLNGGIRQQHAVSYGIIALDAAQQGEPVTSFKVNSQPWNDPIYANKWNKLGRYIGKSPPWVITLYQTPRNKQPEDTTQEIVKTVQQEQEAATKSEHLEKDTEIDALNHTVVHVEDETINMTTQPLLLPEDIETQHHDYGNDEKETQMELPGNKVELTNDPSKNQEEDINEDGGSEVIAHMEHPMKKEIASSTLPPLKMTNDSAKSEETIQQKTVNPEPTQAEARTIERDPENNHIQIDKSKDAEGPVQFVDNGMKQMKLTHLFRYVYTKMKKVKQLPECSPELLGFSHPNKSNMRKRQPVEEVTISGKRKRILDDDFTPEALNLNYAPINGETSGSSKTSDEVNGTTEREDVTDEVYKSKSKISKKEKIRKMREFLKTMFEVEAEESEDENLSDPEDIRKKLQLLKERLQHSEGESESDLETDSEVADEMRDFIGEVEKINVEDEELARQRFFADIQQQEENELAKLMPLKERSERELTRREERMKLLMQLKKNASNLRGIEDLHLSDFESSDDEDGGHRVTGKTKRRISKAEVEQLLKFKTGSDQQSRSISKTEELQQFVDFKLLSSTKQTNDTATITNQVERSQRDRRAIMDDMLSAKLDSAIFGQDTEMSFGSTDPFGTKSKEKPKVTAPAPFGSPKKQAAFVMKSFRWDQSMMKPLNSTNIRNIGVFTGFHNLTNALKENEAVKSAQSKNKSGSDPKLPGATIR